MQRAWIQAKDIESYQSGQSPAGLLISHKHAAALSAARRKADEAAEEEERLARKEHFLPFVAV